MDIKRNVAVIVAHPDDETLWCGGEILMHPHDTWFVGAICRKSDPDRAPKFKEALAAFRANGMMEDLDDGPEQLPLYPELLEEAILNLLRGINYDRIITHSPFGEYTRHQRHEEVGRTIITLWSEQKILTEELWLFAYEDGNKSYYPRAIEHADFCKELPLKAWEEKYRIITEIYGFDKSGFEAQTTPKKEAFWQFNDPEIALQWLEASIENENPIIRNL